MPKITYISFDGISSTVDVPVGQSVMEGAVKNNIVGIDALCGGSCNCATCHVYVDPSWMERVGPRNAGENDMIEFAIDAKENSRLSCQIMVTESLDGLVVRMPKQQGSG
jgi:2Fe-2S ferredoxin